MFSRRRSRPGAALPIMVLSSPVTGELSPVAASAGGVFEVGAALFAPPEALDGRLELPFPLERKDQNAVFGHDDRAVAHPEGEHRRVRKDQVPALVGGLAHLADR